MSLYYSSFEGSVSLSVDPKEACVEGGVLHWTRPIMMRVDLFINLVIV